MNTPSQKIFLFVFFALNCVCVPVAAEPFVPHWVDNPAVGPEESIQAPEEEINPGQVAAPLVDKSGEISDDEARLALVKILAKKRTTSEEALRHLQILLKKKPNDPIYTILLAKVFYQMKRYGQAKCILLEVLNKDPKEFFVLSEAAYLSANLGYLSLSDSLFQRALQVSKEERKYLLLGYAGALQSWGEFEKAATIYHSLADEKSFNIPARLASLMMSEQRFDEAEQIYWNLLCEEFSVKKLLDLVRLKYIIREYQAALDLLETIDLAKPLATEEQKKKDRKADLHLQNELLLLKAQIAEKLFSFDCAASLYLTLASQETHPFEIANYLAHASKAYLKAGDDLQAETLLKKAAALDPESIAIRYALQSSDDQECRLSTIIEQAESPQELNEWANLYLEDAYSDQAVLLTKAAWEWDPEYTTAEFRLAELYPIQFNYAYTRELYEGLLEQFPDNPRYVLGLARVFSWEKLYERSLCYYDQLIERFPDNPLLVLEKARVTLWEQEGDASFSIYWDLFFPTVDCLLADDLAKIQQPSEDILNAREILLRHINANDIYGGFEEIQELMQPKETLLSTHSCSALEASVMRYVGLYRWQKATYLEMLANRAMWNYHYLHALCFYSQLIEFKPGDLEALFGYSQDWCNLGVCEETECIYEQIHQLDPNHSTVNLAIIRSDVQDSPSLFANYDYWDESGRGGLSGISRNRFRFGYNYPFNCQSNVRTFYEAELDHTYIKDRNFVFQAFGVQCQNQFNEHLKASVTVREKFASNYDLHDRRCLADLHVNYLFNDYVQAEFGFARKDEFYNYFGVRQGIQSNSGWTKWDFYLTRKFVVEGLYQYLQYTDHNHQNLGNISLFYQVTEYPKIFKVSLQSDYRNTAHLDEFVYVDNKLVDIIHPYWTPQHYLAGRLELSWNHDLSWFNFCEAEKNYYTIKWMVGTDTEENPASSLNVEWHYDWGNAWSFQVTGLIYRSRQWDADGIWSVLSYHF